MIYDHKKNKSHTINQNKKVEEKVETIKYFFCLKKKRVF